MHRLSLGLSLGLAIALSPTSAVAQDWWQGIWAAESAWCENAARIGSVTPAPIAITAREVLGYENSCVIAVAREMLEAGAVQLTLTCESEGDHFDETRLLMNGGANVLWMWFGAGDPVRFERCPGGDLQWLNRG